MEYIFKPAVRLMNNLTYFRKLMLLGVIAVVVASSLLSTLYVELNRSIIEAELELEGIDKIELVFEMVRHAQQHRGLSASDSKWAQEKYLLKEKEVEAALHNVMDNLPTDFIQKEGLDRFKQDYLVDGHTNKDNSYNEHRHIIAKALLTIKKLADYYKLSIDSRVSSYYLIDSNINITPAIIENLGRIRYSLLEHQASNKKLNSESMQRFTELQYQVVEDFKRLAFNTSVIADDSPALADDINKAYVELEKEKDAILEVLSKILSGHNSSANSFENITVHIDAMYQLMYQQINFVLEKSITNRIYKEKSKLYKTVAIAFGGLLLSLYLVLGVYYSIMSSIQQVNHTLKQHQKGKLGKLVQLKTKDEMQTIGNSINDMARSLKNTLKENKSEKKRFETLFNKNPNGIMIIENGQFVDCNDASLVMMGYEGYKNELLSNPSALSPEYQPDGRASSEKASEMVVRCMKNGSTQFEWLYLKKGGEAIWVNVALNKVDYNNNQVILVNWRDITVEKQLTLDMQQQKERLDTIVDSAMHAAIQITDQGIITGWNVKAEQMFGWSRQEAIGLAVDTLLIPENLRTYHLKGLENSVKTKKVSFHTSELQALNRNGDKFPIEMNVSIIKCKGKIEFSAFIRDLTKQKEYEKSILDAIAVANKANKAKSDFLANMSHELRTPMHGILSFSNFGLKKIDTVPLAKLHRYFQNIHISGERLLVLLNNLLDLSKLDADKMEFDKQPANIIDIFKQCQVEQEERMNELDLSVQINQPETPALVMIDKVRVGQVIINILSNAIKFSPTNSVITVTESKIENDKLLFSMHNNGSSIPELELEDIFDAFIQSSKTDTGAGGTGLGLAISRKIIEGHGGKIWAENSNGGVRFTFELPAVDVSSG